MRSWIIPTISWSVMGRPSMSAARIASTTSPRGGCARRVATNSLIHRNIQAAASRASGLVGMDTAAAFSLSSSELVGGCVQHQVEEGEAGERRGEVGHEVARAALDEAVDEPGHERRGWAARTGATAAAVKNGLISRL